MSRLLFVISMVCLAGAVTFTVRPDPWAKADNKALLDAQRLAGLMESPDRVGWRMSEDPSLARAIVWDPEGNRRYPPPNGLVPLAYEFSEEMIRSLTAKQKNTRTSEWTFFDTTDQKLLNCRATPTVCLIYHRDVLERSLELRSGALGTQGDARQIGMLLAILAWITGAGAFWIRRRNSDTALNFKVLPNRHMAMRGSLEVPLTPRDLKLLTVLQERDGDVVTKDELYDAGWGRDYMPNSRALDQHMINLRQKLDPDKSRPVLIETVHGVGYRLVR